MNDKSFIKELRAWCVELKEGEEEARQLGRDRPEDVGYFSGLEVARCMARIKIETLLEQRNTSSLFSAPTRGVTIDSLSDGFIYEACGNSGIPIMEAVHLSENPLPLSTRLRDVPFNIDDLLSRSDDELQEFIEHTNYHDVENMRMLLLADKAKGHDVVIFIADSVSIDCLTTLKNR